MCSIMLMLGFTRDDQGTFNHFLDELKDEFGEKKMNKSVYGLFWVRDYPREREREREREMWTCE